MIGIINNVHCRTNLLFARVWGEGDSASFRLTPKCAGCYFSIAYFDLFPYD